MPPGTIRPLASKDPPWLGKIPECFNGTGILAEEFAPHEITESLVTRAL
jgi:hypothetical protein